MGMLYSACRPFNKACWGLGERCSDGCRCSPHLRCNCWDVYLSRERYTHVRNDDEGASLTSCSSSFRCGLQPLLAQQPGMEPGALIKYGKNYVIQTHPEIRNVVLFISMYSNCTVNALHATGLAMAHAVVWHGRARVQVPTFSRTCQYHHIGHSRSQFQTWAFVEGIDVQVHHAQVYMAHAHL